MSSKPTKLTGEERAQGLKSIPNWTESTTRDAIERKFLFKDFNGRNNKKQFCN